MITPLDIADTIQEFFIIELPAWIDEFDSPELPLEELDDEQIIVAWPDTDRYQSPAMIFLQPGQDDISPLTLGTEQHSLVCDIYIVCRKDTPENIMRKAFRYYAALKSALYADRSLGGFCDEALFSAVDFFPNVEANPGICAIKIQMTISYSEEL